MKWLLTFTFAMACIIQQAHAQQNVVVTPFEVLDTHPLCKGKGTIAYKVRFEAANTMGRFGNVDDARPVVCSVRHRKGGKVTDIAIPCPASADTGQTGAQPYDLAAEVAASVEFVGCITLTTHAVVEANWRLTSSTDFGNYTAMGDLSDPSVSFVYSGPTFESEDSDRHRIFLQPAWAVIFRDTAVASGQQPEDRLNLTSYVVLSPEPLMQHICIRGGYPPEDCEPQPVSDFMVKYMFGSTDFDEVVGFVAGEK